MKKTIFGRLSILVIIALVLGACSQGGAVEIGEEAPDFSLKDMDGKTVNLSDFKGKVVILDFFATWCPPCRGEIPDFVELQKAYGSQGAAIIGVSNEAPGELKAFAGEFGINYPVLVDAQEAAQAAYGPIRAVPTTFVIGKDSKIARVYVGARPKEVFENDIKELLK